MSAAPDASVVDGLSKLVEQINSAVAANQAQASPEQARLLAHTEFLRQQALALLAQQVNKGHPDARSAQAAKVRVALQEHEEIQGSDDTEPFSCLTATLVAQKQQEYRQAPYSTGQLPSSVADPIQVAPPFTFQRSLTTARPPQLPSQFGSVIHFTPTAATATQRRGSEPGVRPPSRQQQQVQSALNLAPPAPSVAPLPVPGAVLPAATQAPPKPPPAGSTASRWGKAFKLALGSSKESQAQPPNKAKSPPPAPTAPVPAPVQAPPPIVTPVVPAPGPAFQFLPSLSLPRAGTSTRSTRYSTLENILEAELEAEYEALQEKQEEEEREARGKRAKRGSSPAQPSLRHNAPSATFHTAQAPVQLGQQHSVTTGTVEQPQQLVGVREHPEALREPQTGRDSADSGVSLGTSVSLGPEGSIVTELSSDSVGDTLLRDHDKQEEVEQHQFHGSFPSSPVPFAHRKCDVTPCSAHHTLRRMPASPGQQVPGQHGTANDTAAVPDSNRGSTDEGGTTSKSLSRLQMKRPPPINTALPLSPNTAGALKGGVVAGAQAMGSPVAGAVQGQAWGGKGVPGLPQQQAQHWPRATTSSSGGESSLGGEHHGAGSEGGASNTGSHAPGTGSLRPTGSSGGSTSNAPDRQRSTGGGGAGGGMMAGLFKRKEVRKQALALVTNSDHLGPLQRNISSRVKEAQVAPVLATGALQHWEALHITHVASAPQIPSHVIPGYMPLQQQQACAEGAAPSAAAAQAQWPQQQQQPVPFVQAPPLHASPLRGYPELPGGGSQVPVATSAVPSQGVQPRGASGEAAAVPAVHSTPPRPQLPSVPDTVAHAAGAAPSAAAGQVTHPADAAGVRHPGVTSGHTSMAAPVAVAAAAAASGPLARALAARTQLRQGTQGVSTGASAAVATANPLSQASAATAVPTAVVSTTLAPASTANSTAAAVLPAATAAQQGMAPGQGPHVPPPAPIPPPQTGVGLPGAPAVHVPAAVPSSTSVVPHTAAAAPAGQAPVPVAVPGNDQSSTTGALRVSYGTAPDVPVQTQSRKKKPVMPAFLKDAVRNNTVLVTAAPAAENAALSSAAGPAVQQQEAALAGATGAQVAAVAQQQQQQHPGSHAMTGHAKGDAATGRDQNAYNSDVRHVPEQQQVPSHNWPAAVPNMLTSQTRGAPASGAMYAAAAVVAPPATLPGSDGVASKYPPIFNPSTTASQPMVTMPSGSAPPNTTNISNPSNHGASDGGNNSTTVWESAVSGGQQYSTSTAHGPLASIPEVASSSEGTADMGSTGRHGVDQIRSGHAGMHGTPGAGSTTAMPIHVMQGQHAAGAAAGVPPPASELSQPGLTTDASTESDASESESEEVTHRGASVTPQSNFRHAGAIAMGQGPSAGSATTTGEEPSLGGPHLAARGPLQQNKNFQHAPHQGQGSTQPVGFNGSGDSVTGPDTAEHVPGSQPAGAPANWDVVLQHQREAAESKLAGVEHSFDFHRGTPHKGQQPGAGPGVVAAVHAALLAHHQQQQGAFSRSPEVQRQGAGGGQGGNNQGYGGPAHTGGAQQGHSTHQSPSGMSPQQLSVAQRARWFQQQQEQASAAAQPARAQTSARSRTHQASAPASGATTAATTPTDSPRVIQFPAPAHEDSFNRQQQQHVPVSPSRQVFSTGGIMEGSGAEAADVASAQATEQGLRFISASGAPQYPSQGAPPTSLQQEQQVGQQAGVNSVPGATTSTAHPSGSYLHAAPPPTGQPQSTPQFDQNNSVSRAVPADQHQGSAPPSPVPRVDPTSATQHGGATGGYGAVRQYSPEPDAISSGAPSSGIADSASSHIPRAARGGRTNANNHGYQESQYQQHHHQQRQQQHTAAWVHHGFPAAPVAPHGYPPTYQAASQQASGYPPPAYAPPPPGYPTAAAAAPGSSMQPYGAVQQHYGTTTQRTVPPSYHGASMQYPLVTGPGSGMAGGVPPPGYPTAGVGYPLAHGGPAVHGMAVPHVPAAPVPPHMQQYTGAPTEAYRETWESDVQQVVTQQQQQPVAQPQKQPTSQQQQQQTRMGPAHSHTRSRSISPMDRRIVIPGISPRAMADLEQGAAEGRLMAAAAGQTKAQGGVPAGAIVAAHTRDYSLGFMPPEDEIPAYTALASATTAAPLAAGYPSHVAGRSLSPQATDAYAYSGMHDTAKGPVGPQAVAAAPASQVALAWRQQDMGSHQQRSISPAAAHMAQPPAKAAGAMSVAEAAALAAQRRGLQQQGNKAPPPPSAVEPTAGAATVKPASNVTQPGHTSQGNDMPQGHTFEQSARNRSVSPMDRRISVPGVRPEVLEAMYAGQQQQQQQQPAALGPPTAQPSQRSTAEGVQAPPGAGPNNMPSHSSTTNNTSYAAGSNQQYNHQQQWGHPVNRPPPPAFAQAVPAHYPAASSHLPPQPPSLQPSQARHVQQAASAARPQARSGGGGGMATGPPAVHQAPPPPGPPPPPPHSHAEKGPQRPAAASNNFPGSATGARPSAGGAVALPPPPPPGPPPPPPLVASTQGPVVVRRSSTSSSVAPGGQGPGGPGSVGSSVSLASSQGMAEVLSAISTLGQQGGYKGHLRSLSKSKAKRGPRGELAASQQGPLIPGGARALLGGRQTPVQGTPPPGHGSSSTVASARSTPLSLGALGAATAGAAQVRGAEQARLLLQRVRAMQARSSSGSSEDSWN